MSRTQLSVSLGTLSLSNVQPKENWKSVHSYIVGTVFWLSSQFLGSSENLKSIIRWSIAESLQSLTLRCLLHKPKSPLFICLFACFALLLGSMLKSVHCICILPEKLTAIFVHEQ